MTGKILPTMAALILAAALLIGLRARGQRHDPNTLKDDHSAPAAVTPLAPARAAAIPSYGSQSILEACWSPAELRGTPDEKRSRVDPHPFARPPGRAVPIHSPPQTPLPPGLSRSIRSVTPRDGRKVVALTFDLCEGPGERTGYDAAIVNYLRANQVRATFFAGGKWMHSHPERAMQLLADPLFEVGAHGWNHLDLRRLSGEALADQVLWTQGEYELLWEELSQRPCAAAAGPLEMERIPLVPLVFRFPYGSCSAPALDFVNRSGLPAIQWSIVTGDPMPNRTAAGIVATVLGQIRPGAIVIGHANGRGHGTAQALAVFVPRLRARGYEFVTVSELLAEGTEVAASDCYSVRPGDTWNLSRSRNRKAKAGTPR